MSDQDKLWEKIKDIRIAMMTTQEADGTLRSRPMYTQEVEETPDHLWFFTRDNSGKVDEILSDANVNLSYADPSAQRYVSVSGRAILSRDKSKMEELWHPGLKAWFPDGLDDPTIALIKVDAEQAEYWEGESNKLVKLFAMAKAAVTDGDYDAGENEKLSL